MCLILNLTRVCTYKICAYVSEDTRLRSYVVIQYSLYTNFSSLRINNLRKALMTWGCSLPCNTRIGQSNFGGQFRWYCRSLRCLQWCFWGERVKLEKSSAAFQCADSFSCLPNSLASRGHVPVPYHEMVIWKCRDRLVLTSYTSQQRAGTGWGFLLPVPLCKWKEDPFGVEKILKSNELCKY